MAWPCALTSTMDVMCCCCVLRRQLRVFLPFLTQTPCCTVENWQIKTPSHPRSRCDRGCSQPFLNQVSNSYQYILSTAEGSKEQRHAAIQQSEHLLKQRKCASRKQLTPCFTTLKKERRVLHTGSLTRHGLSFISGLGQCGAHHSICALIHPCGQHCLNKTGLWTPLHVTRLVAIAESKVKKAKKRDT